VATILDKALKRQVTVNGIEYKVLIDPDGIRLTPKGKRKAEVELRWRDLLSGEAAMAVALNASLSAHRDGGTVKTSRAPDRTTPAARKRAR
jgi:hypothetical protein